MSKFDTVYSDLVYSLNEREYVNSTFEDNIRSLVKILKDSDYLDINKDVERNVEEIMMQPKNVKEINLDTQERSLPAMRLHVKQPTDSESFSVTVIDLEKPDQQKEFANSMLETIFNDVCMYIKTTAMQGRSVDELPPAEGANQQPGGGESALPTA